MTDSEETLVSEVSFHEDHDRWKGRFEIFRRTVYRDGRSRTYSNLRVRIGTRYLDLPCHDPETFIAAYRSAVEAHAQDHEALMREIGTRRPTGAMNRRPDRRRRRDDCEGAD